MQTNLQFLNSNAKGKHIRSELVRYKYYNINMRVLR